MKVDVTPFSRKGELPVLFSLDVFGGLRALSGSRVVHCSYPGSSHASEKRSVLLVEGLFISLRNRRFSRPGRQRRRGLVDEGDEEENKEPLTKGGVQRGRIGGSTGLENGCREF